MCKKVLPFQTHQSLVRIPVQTGRDKIDNVPKVRFKIESAREKLRKVS
jgi:hypothetical protein